MDIASMPQSEKTETQDASVHISAFNVLYESADDRFALYEVYDGHLVAIDTSKLA